MPVELVAVRASQAGELVLLPTERDGSLALHTLRNEFPGCCGLTFVHPKTDTTRGLRLKDGHLYPPSEGWGRFKYLCNFPKDPSKPTSQKDATDLIVLGLPWKTTEQTVREYFEGFGRVKKVWLKRDSKGQSKGFAFVRFASYHTQMKVLTEKHVIDGRRCDVLIPHSKKGLPFKVFVGGCTENMSAEDLRSYFYKFGEVTDVFVPKPFRPFGFVTFLDPEMAQSVCEETHVIKGVSVNVSIASPRQHQSRNQNNFKDNHCPYETVIRNNHNKYDVDMLNFQSLSIDGGQHADSSYNNRFAEIDQGNIWGNFSNLVAPDHTYNLNNSGGNAYGGSNYYPWVHANNYPASSGQWQISGDQQRHPS